MNNLVYILFLLFACSSPSSKNQSSDSSDITISTESDSSDAPKKEVQNNPKSQNSFIDKSQFKVPKQSSFSLVNWYYGARQEKLVIMMVDEVKRYFQDSKLKNNLDNNYGNYYFFSVQETSPSIVITLIEEYDVCCADLLLMRYDSSNKLISREKVAGTGGDGIWGYNEYGNFTSDSTYQLIRVDQETIKDEQDTMEYRIDSVVTQFRVNTDFSFKKQEEKAFERTKVIAN